MILEERVYFFMRLKIYVLFHEVKPTRAADYMLNPF